MRRSALTPPSGFDPRSVWSAGADRTFLMVRLVAFFLVAAMLVQVIRPIGVIGLQRRADAWKIGILAVAIVSVLSALKIDT